MDSIGKPLVFYVSREPNGRWIVREQGMGTPLGVFCGLLDAWDYANHLAKSTKGSRAMLDQGRCPATNSALQRQTSRALSASAEQPPREWALLSRR
jgi:hypothetical protein